MDRLALADGFQALAVRGGNNFVLVNPGSFQQQVIRGTGIDGMKSVAGLMDPTVKSG